MKLAEFAATLPQYTSGRNTHAARDAFEDIGAFIFGEKYQIITGTREPGKFSITDVFDFQDLPTILNILHDEFDPRTDCVPEMVLTTSRDLDKVLALPHGTSIADTASNGLGMKGTADERILVVRPGPASPAFERPTMDCYIEMFRTQITMYNLTQSWDQMEGRANL